MDFSVTILGSNSALPTSERYPTAQVLSVSERFFLIDCGEGTQMQLRKYKVKFTKINQIFISHLHGDHVFGLPGLIATMGLLGRKSDLHIYAHSDLPKLLKPQLEYYCADLPYEVVFHSINPSSRNIVFQDKKIQVETIPLKHRVPTCGFLFSEVKGLPNIRKSCIDEYNLSIAEIVKIKEGGDLRLDDGTIVPNENLVIPQPKPRSYAFCTDTRYIPSLGQLLNGVDLLYHETTFTNEHTELAKKSFHSTAEQAAMVARDAAAGKLIIGHFSSRNRNLEPYLIEARAVFPQTFLATEGKVFEIPINAI
jgi:ribonuclease Z